METASGGYKAEGASSQTAGFNSDGDGGRSNVPVAVKGTIPFGKFEAVAVAGATVADTKCRGGVLPHASRLRVSANKTTEQQIRENFGIGHLGLLETANEKIVSPIQTENKPLGTSGHFPIE